MKYYRAIAGLLFCASSLFAQTTYTAVRTSDPIAIYGMKWRGTWTNGTNYAKNDVVLYNGTSYVSLIDNNLSQTPSSSSSSWTATGSASSGSGTQGPAGPQGPQGPTGPQGPPGSGSGGLSGGTPGDFVNINPSGNEQDTSLIHDNGTNLVLGRPLSYNDTVNNSSDTWHTGSGGDSTCPTTVPSGSFVRCIRNGKPQISFANGVWSTELSLLSGATPGHLLAVGSDGASAVDSGSSSSGSGNGTGTVTTVAAPSGSWPSWLTPTVTNNSTTPSLAVTASPIPNSALANTSTTVNGQNCQLGGGCTIGSISAANSLGISITNVNTAHVSQLSSLTSSNSILAVGSTVLVSDANSCGDTNTGGGTTFETLYCSAVSTTCTSWRLVSCSAGGTTGGGGGTSALLGEWLLNEGSTPVVDHATGDLSPMSTITATWVGASSPLTNALSFTGDSSSYAVGVSNAKLQMEYTQPFSWWGWVNLSTPSTGADGNPRFLDNINSAGAGIGWSVGANYNMNSITGCTATTYCPLVELIGAGGYPNNSYDAFCQQGITAGGWHLVALTYDGQHNSNSTKCWIDNVAYSGQTISTSVNSTTVSTDYIAMGNLAGASTSNTNGLLGPQGVIGRVLTDTDVATLWGNPYAVLQ